MKNKFIVGGVAIAVLGSLSRLGVEALQISTPNFVTPIFKAIFLKAGGDDTQPAGVKLDGNGIYISDANPTAIQGQNTVLRLDGSNSFVRDFITNNSIASGSIGASHILSGSITTINIGNLEITNNTIQNNTLELSSFDPNISWPTGDRVYTNGNCTGANAIISAVNGNITCAAIGTGGSTIPTCSEGSSPVFSGGQWNCQLVLLSATGANDPHWSGSIDIWNTALKRVGIGLTNPTNTLTVSGSMKVDGESPAMIYCYASDTWVLTGTFNEDVCMGCNQGYSYNAASNKCERVSCIGGGLCGSSHGGTFASTPNNNLCAAGAGSSAVLLGSGADTGKWVWKCTNGSVVNSCYAYVGGGTGVQCTNELQPGTLLFGPNWNPLQASSPFSHVNSYNERYEQQVIGGGSNHGDVFLIEDEFMPGVYHIAINTVGGYDPNNPPSNTYEVKIKQSLGQTNATGGALIEYMAGIQMGDWFVSNTTGRYATGSSFAHPLAPNGILVEVTKGLTCTELRFNLGGGKQIGGGGSSNIYVQNFAGGGDQINDINSNGAQFFIINQGSYSLSYGDSLDGIHGGLGANDMDYNIVDGNGDGACIYTYINNQPPAGPGACGAAGASQTQIGNGGSNGTIFAPAFSSTDRVDIVMCGGICN